MPLRRSSRNKWLSSTGLSDDLVRVILSKLAESGDRKSFSMVCRQWYMVEGDTHKSLTICVQDHIPNLNLSLRVLSTRFPNLVHLQTHELSNANLKIVAKTCKNLETIFIVNHAVNLGRMSGGGLSTLGYMCPKLWKVRLSGKKNRNNAVAWLAVSASNLTRLELNDCSLIGDLALGDIASEPTCSITSLVLKRCCKITDSGLAVLATGSKIKRLFIYECPKITDTGLRHLRNMRSLEHLELYYIYGGGISRRITDIGGVAISKIRTLKTLRLLYLFDVTDTTVVAIANNCRKLEVLDLKGCYKVTGRGIRALATHKCLKRLGLLRINKRLHPSDLDTVALGCQTLEPESVLVDLRYRHWSSQFLHVTTRRVVKFSNNQV